MVALFGGPLDGEFFTGTPGDRLAFPVLKPDDLAKGVRFTHPDDAAPIGFTQAVYHRTSRTDAAGRVVFEYHPA